MRARGRGDVNPVIPNRGSRWRWVISFTSRPFYALRPRYLLNRGLWGLQIRFRYFRERNRATIFWSSNAWPCHYTDWATAAQTPTTVANVNTNKWSRCPASSHSTSPWRRVGKWRCSAMHSESWHVIVGAIHCVQSCNKLQRRIRPGTHYPHVTWAHVMWCGTHAYSHVTLSHVSFWCQPVGGDKIPVVSVSV